MAKNKRQPKTGYVYLLKSTCGNYIKYGASKRPEKRLREINRNNPCSVEFFLVKKIESSDIFDLERQIKWKFWENHVGLYEYIEIDGDFSFSKALEVVEEVCHRDG